MIYLPNIIISLIKKLRLYNFLKKIYKKILERFISFEIKTIENYIINNLVEKNFGAINKQNLGVDIARSRDSRRV